MERKRGILLGVGVGALVVLAAALVWFGPMQDDDGGGSAPDLGERSPARSAVDGFADAWRTGTLDEVPATEESGNVANRNIVLMQDLVPTTGNTPASVKVVKLRDITPKPTEKQPDPPDRIEADLKVTWGLGGDRTWSYDTTAEFVDARADDPNAKADWRLDWTPAVVHPKLVEGDKIGVLRVAPSRGEILGLDGEPLVGLRPVVYVSIDPNAVSDRDGTARQVAGLVGVDADSLADRVVNSTGGAVSVVTLRKEAYDPIAASLQAIPGVSVAEDELPLAPTRDWARALIGSVGPATAEEVAATEGRVQEGEMVGLSGLQASQDEVLGGKPGLSIRAASTTGEHEAVVLADFPAEDGKPVTITLDPKIQEAADDALANAPGPAALVAIRPSTGDVLAVANGPAGADGYNRAMVGSYPPGSTFKVASGLALLENGLTPDTEVDCPATIVVGREFQNAEGEVLGTVPFRTDFAKSCNTAFIGESRDITAQQLADTAASLGFRDLDVGAPLATGKVPVTDSETEHAANMIGQGKVEASPFVVALMSASVAAGRTIEPRLVVEAGSEPEEGEPLPEQAVTDLRSLMRSVVTDGTGSAVAGVPGGDVAGKTGTAEYGSDDPPRTHAWFTGFQGDVAFAVLVEDGGFGGQTAAPIAADFLTKLANG